MNMEGKQKQAATQRKAHRGKDLTQRALARLARVPQPTIAAIESARREPSLSLLSCVVESAGYGIQLDLVPLARFGAVSTAGRIERALLEDQEPYRVEDSVLRLVLSFRDEIRHVDADALRELIDEPPSLSRSCRGDALHA